MEQIGWCTDPFGTQLFRLAKEDHKVRLTCMRVRFVVCVGVTLSEASKVPKKTRKPDGSVIDALKGLVLEPKPKESR